VCYTHAYTHTHIYIFIYWDNPYGTPYLQAMAAIDSGALAACTDGFSGAELAGLVRAASSFALERYVSVYTHLSICIFALICIYVYIYIYIHRLLGCRTSGTCSRGIVVCSRALRECIYTSIYMCIFALICIYVYIYIHRLLGCRTSGTCSRGIVVCSRALRECIYTYIGFSGAELAGLVRAASSFALERYVSVYTHLSVCIFALICINVYTYIHRLLGCRTSGTCSRGIVVRTREIRKFIDIYVYK